MTSLTDTVVEHGRPGEKLQRPPIPSFSPGVQIPEHDGKHIDDDDDILSKELLTLPQTASPSPRSKPLPIRKEKHLDSRTIPPIIPPEHDHRTLVLCFDGTGDQLDADNSNIVQLFSLLKRDDSSKQMVYYQAGIGTYTSPNIATPLMSKISQTLDSMVALHLDAHVMDGYEFLMQNYTVNDRICIFGFSRGAYTARSLAGMIHKVGLLPPSNFQQVPFAYKMYTRTDEIGWEQSNLFKKTFSRDVQIEFIGVWDTVDSVGIIPKRLPFTTSNTIVRTFRHALALDERRAKFKANLWNRPTPEESNLGTKGGPHRPESAEPWTEGPENEKSIRTSHHSHRHSHEKDPSRPSFEWLDSDDVIQSSFEGQYSARDVLDKPTDIEEVWFAGCHCDVGGGSVKNFTRHSLARISLRWMVRECFKTNTGIMFDSYRLRTIGLDPSTLYPLVTPRPPPHPVDNTRIRSIPADDPYRSPGLSERLLSELKNSIPRLNPRISSSGRKEKGKTKNQDNGLSIPQAVNTVQSATTKFMGSIRKKFARGRTLDSDELDIQAVIASPPPKDPMKVVEEGAAYGSLTEEQEELYDAMSPKYDQLKLAPSWWILEYIPMSFRYQKGNNCWVTTFGMNRARPRHIPRQRSEGVKVHRSVKMRNEAIHEKLRDGKPKKYVPKAFLVDERITWVD